MQGDPARSDGIWRLVLCQSAHEKGLLLKLYRERFWASVYHRRILGFELSKSDDHVKELCAIMWGDCATFWITLPHFYEAPCVCVVGSLERSSAPPATSIESKCTNKPRRWLLTDNTPVLLRSNSFWLEWKWPSPFRNKMVRWETDCRQLWFSSALWRAGVGPHIPETEASVELIY